VVPCPIISSRPLRVFDGHQSNAVKPMVLEYMQHACRSEIVVRRLAYIVSLAGPLAALPQVLSIWTYHQAAGVSFWSSLGVTAIAVFWLAYGVILRDGPIVLSSGLWMILDLAIVSGVLRYGVTGG
jgi:uncharacterized protein with PQ loop repeat